MKTWTRRDVVAEPGSSRPGVQRRKVMLSAALAPTLSFPFGSLNATSTTRADVVGAVFDRRFQQSLAFAERAKSQGIRQVGISGEIFTLWSDEILPALRARRLPLIGLIYFRDGDHEFARTAGWNVSFFVDIDILIGRRCATDNSHSAQ